MKQEHQSPAGAATFKSLKDVEAASRGRMEKVVAELHQEMAHLRTGRASIGLLDSVRVEYYGSPVPLNQVAQLHAPEPSMITVQPWDPAMIAAVEKAIRGADLGLNPSNDGKIVRVPIPALTQERRRELAKKLSHIAEERRVSLRNVRRDANDQIKKLLKEKLISEDDERQGLEAVQKLTDTYIGKIDQAAKVKEKEILEFN
ncbi:MAG TPA: ribosome recycling factor [Bryobacteraceae bacterium]